MLMVLLGIGSGLSWGVADFFGGLQSRRLPALGVALWSQIVGALALLCVILVWAGQPVPGGIAWGIGGGFFGGLGLVCFYRGLAVGTMSIVAPISACGAVVPVAVALLLGEVPSLLTSLGIVAAFAGIVLVSLTSDAASAGSSQPRAALLLALGAALGFGTFYVFLDRGAAFGGSPLWAVGGTRAGSLVMLSLMVLLGRRAAPWPGRNIGPIGAVGVLDTTANALYAYATTLGNLGVVAVLGSLYPVATVLLGRVVLAERLSHTQHAGVACALSGVVLISAG